MKAKQLLCAALLLCSASVSAQNNVINDYITNADFSQGTLATVAICTYAHDMEKNGTTFCNLVDLDGWTSVDNSDGKAGGPIAIGSGVWVGGSGYTAPATNSDGVAQGNVLGLVGCWGATAQYTQEVSQALPAGEYTLVLAVYNSKGGTTAIAKNLIGFIEDGGTEHLATTTLYPVNSWKYEFINFTLSEATAGYITIGYLSQNTGSGNMPHLFLSGLELYNGTLDAASYEAAKQLKIKKAEWELAKAQAEEVLAQESEAAPDQSLVTALQNAINAVPEATIEGYEAAITQINAAVEALQAAPAIFEAYNAAVENVQDNLPYLDYASQTAIQAVSAAMDGEPQTAAEAKAMTDALATAVRAYFESHSAAEALPDAVMMTEVITNPYAEDGNNGWTIEGNMNEPRNTESWTDSYGYNTYMYFDGGNWGATGWTTTMEQIITLPAGRYMLTAKGRASLNTTLTLAVGEESVELPHVGSTGNWFDRGWGDGSVEFNVEEESDVTILVTATTEALHEWFSVSDFRLVYLEGTTTGISEVNTAAAKAETFNLAGQRVNNAQKGLFITNGKKVVVK